MARIKYRNRYLTVSDEDAAFVRSLQPKLCMVNSAQIGVRNQGPLARILAKRFARVGSRVVVQTGSPTDFRREKLAVVDRARVLRGAGVKRTKHGTYEATIAGYYCVAWRGRYGSRLAAVRARNRQLIAMGYVA